jgi:hypothetical protein
MWAEFGQGFEDLLSGCVRSGRRPPIRGCLRCPRTKVLASVSTMRSSSNPGWCLHTPRRRYRRASRRTGLGGACTPCSHGCRRARPRPCSGMRFPPGRSPHLSFPGAKGARNHPAGTDPGQPMVAAVRALAAPCEIPLRGVEDHEQPGRPLLPGPRPRSA